MQPQDTVDRLALGLAGATMLVGVVVLGIVEILAGQPYGAAPVTNEAGEVVATPAVDPVLRTGLVVAGLVVLFLWGLYRMTLAEGTDREERAGAPANT
ncbi:hypothetical protein C2R22_19830 [Salinigranum rubrum]|uniref:Cox cluster protein n=1 Tax=Salinigranum rubrum TaxID=755307 RepID=A0A2I8VNX5_9EURY|nr:hypothetical protein [Salinigranum rubrum]AUV83616.1 hypothetical protein C2R22_19830 [Salinigranum rubrum]